jgi:hypothetical protein
VVSDGERLPIKVPHDPDGRPGPKGERGARGEQGMGRTMRRAIVYLFAAGFILSSLSLLFTVHYVHAQQAAQRQAGLLVERKICTTLGSLAALRPPPGNPAANPSRAFDQGLHERLDELGGDLGCKGANR